MPAWNCIAGSTLLVPSGPKGHHLFIILNEPADFKGYPPQSCISVALCSIGNLPNYDATCVVQPNEHPFVKHPSYVAYRHTRIDQASHFEQMVQNYTAFPQQDAPQVLLHRIRAGIHASKQTSNLYKQLMTP